MELPDREISCASCGQTFSFTAGEQGWYARNGMQEPRRCKPCRAQRKADGGGVSAAPRSHGNGNGNVASPRGNDRRPTHAAGPARDGGYRLAAPDDPNGYRAPGFQSDGRAQYAIDYAGLPRDVEDGSDAPSPGNERSVAGGPIDRFGMRTAATPTASAPRSGNGPRAFSSGLPRGMNGRRTDRAGTDPSAYRSPAFAGSAPAPQARRPRSDTPTAQPGAAPGTSRRDRRAQRARFEAVCSDCGVDALVPFQPAPDRLAYCKNCYQVRKANGTVPMPSLEARASSDAAAPLASE